MSGSFCQCYLLKVQVVSYKGQYFELWVPKVAQPLAAAALQASLSGTFLQTVPELVTSLKGALLISMQLSTDAVNALQNVWAPIRLWTQHCTKARTQT